jgi:hypothetical protein
MWIDIAVCFDFWKSELDKHLTDNTHEIELDNILTIMYMLQASGPGIKMPDLLLNQSFTVKTNYNTRVNTKRPKSTSKE